jgi:hypothetical protein
MVAAQRHMIERRRHMQSKRAWHPCLSPLETEADYSV